MQEITASLLSTQDTSCLFCSYRRKSCSTSFSSAYVCCCWATDYCKFNSFQQPTPIISQFPRIGIWVWLSCSHTQVLTKLWSRIRWAAFVSGGLLGKNLLPNPLRVSPEFVSLQVHDSGLCFLAAVFQKPLFALRGHPQVHATWRPPQSLP